MQTNLSRSHTPPDQYILWPKPLQSQVQTTRDHLGVCQNYPNYLILSLFSTLTFLTHSFPWEYGEGLWLRHSLQLLLPRGWPWYYSTWPCMAQWIPLLSGTVSNELSFQQTILLICWPYCTWIKPKSWLLFITVLHTPFCLRGESRLLTHILIEVTGLLGIEN